MSRAANLLKMLEASKHTIEVYFQVVSPKSAKQGEVEDSGHETTIDVDGYTQPNATDQSIVGTTTRILNDAGITNVKEQGSASHFYPGIWYSSQPDVDTKTRYERTLTYHLNGYTEDEERDVYTALAKI